MTSSQKIAQESYILVCKKAMGRCGHKQIQRLEADLTSDESVGACSSMICPATR